MGLPMQQTHQRMRWPASNRTATQTGQLKMLITTSCSSRQPQSSPAKGDCATAAPAVIGMGALTQELQQQMLMVLRVMQWWMVMRVIVTLLFSQQLNVLERLHNSLGQVSCGKASNGCNAIVCMECSMQPLAR